MKKFLPLIIIIAVLLIGAGLFFVFKPSSGSLKPTPKPNEPVNTIDVKDRPYITLSPTVAGKHPLGREVTFTLNSTPLASQTLD